MQRNRSTARIHPIDNVVSKPGSRIQHRAQGLRRSCLQPPFAPTNHPLGHEGFQNLTQAPTFLLSSEMRRPIPIWSTVGMYTRCRPAILTLLVTRAPLYPRVPWTPEPLIPVPHGGGFVSVGESLLARTSVRALFKSRFFLESATSAT